MKNVILETQKVMMNSAQVGLIGKAKKGTQSGVILASFNAG